MSSRKNYNGCGGVAGRHINATKKMKPIGELVRRTQRHMDTVQLAQQYNTWLYLL